MADSYITAREKVAATYEFTIRRKDQSILIALSSLTLTLTNKATAEVINGRDHQNAINANDVTFTSGVVVWSLQPADTELSGDADEIHLALFEWEATNEADFHEVEIAVPNTRARF